MRLRVTTKWVKKINIVFQHALQGVFCAAVSCHFVVNVSSRYSICSTLAVHHFVATKWPAQPHQGNWKGDSFCRYIKGQLIL